MLQTRERDEFLAKAAANFAAQAEYTALACGGRVESWNGVVMCDARSGHRYRNMAVPTRPLDRAESDDLAHELRDFYGNDDRWILSAVVPISPSNGLLVVDQDEEFMYFPSGPVEAPSHPDLEIREVTDRTGMQVFETVWATAYQKPHLLKPDAVRYDERILGNGQRLWLGYLGSTAVSTAGSYVHGGLNMVRGITTIHSHRGRGIGKAMTLQSMSVTELPRFLNSEVGIEEMYRKVGFESIATFRFWKWNQDTNSP